MDYGWYHLVSFTFEFTFDNENAYEMAIELKEPFECIYKCIFNQSTSPAISWNFMRLEK